MQVFELSELLQQHASGDDLYLEFLRVPALNCGIYRLPAGGPDPQEPHDEDEVYYVIEGAGRFTCEGDEVPVGPGTILYVKAGDEHRFHDISADLTILVFFAGS